MELIRMRTKQILLFGLVTCSLTGNMACKVNDYNLDRTVEIKGIEPNDEGVVYIEMKPGPNNVQWAKFFGVNTMVLSEEEN